MDEYPNYIHANFVKVPAYLYMQVSLILTKMVIFVHSGLPREENIHHSSESNGKHCQRLLEDDSGLQSTCSGHVVFTEGEQHSQCNAMWSMKGSLTYLLYFQETCYCYWPQGESQEQFGEFTIKLTSMTKQGWFVIRELVVFNKVYTCIKSYIPTKPC